MTRSDEELIAAVAAGAEPDRSLFMVPPDYTVKDTNIRRVEPSRQH